MILILSGRILGNFWEFLLLVKIETRSLYRSSLLLILVYIIFT